VAEQRVTEAVRTVAVIGGYGLAVLCVVLVLVAL
jgi:hypothetical protein